MINKEMYVITNYWDNGEGYGDKYWKEVPIIGFTNLDKAKNFCVNNNGQIKIEKSHIIKPEYLLCYSVITDEQYIYCPLDLNWESCNEEYREEYCETCQSFNSDKLYDNSFREYRIYKIKLD